MLKKNIFYFFLFIIFILGFCLRIYGIKDSHSFWADEAYVASFARDVVQGKASLMESMKVQDYQPFQVVIMAASFKLLGFSEFAARLPYVIFGSLGVVAIFLIAMELSTPVSALLAAF